MATRRPRTTWAARRPSSTSASPAPAPSGIWHHLHEANPALWLLGSDGVAQEHLAGGLSPGAAERSRFFTGARASFELYGYEALALALDAIAAGGGDREQITRAARATRDRTSVIGEYSLDDDGRTTTSAYGELAVVGSRLVWLAALSRPRSSCAS